MGEGENSVALSEGFAPGASERKMRGRDCPLGEPPGAQAAVRRAILGTMAPWRASSLRISASGTCNGVVPERAAFAGQLATRSSGRTRGASAHPPGRD
jgi:hypothetical protein